MNLEALNENQLKAVSAPLKNIKVVAGPGSGKTHVIVHRIAYMLEKYDCLPSSILVITFTKAAAQEMKERFIRNFQKNGVQFGTFHSVFYRILKTFDGLRYDLTHLLSDDEKKQVIQKISQEMEVEEEDFLETFLSHLTLMHNQLIQPHYYNPDGLSKEVFLKVYYAYEHYKEQHCKFDFDDMLTHCYHALKNDVTLLKHYQQKYRHILIDEFQDINCVQFEIVKLLTTSNHTLFVVGDDDQSIYRFRGSKPEFLLELEKYYETMETVVLDQNYRSTKNILNYSNVVITQNQMRYPKLMHTQNEQGTLPQIIVVEDLNEQAQKILGDLVTIKKNGGHFSECAVIYRTNIEVRSILNVLLAANIPFQLKDAVATLLDQWITKDIEAYFQLAKNPNQVIYLERIINRPNRYIGRAALQEAKGRSEDVLSYLLQSESLMSQQKERLDELRFHLQKLAKLPFADGVKFIRQQIGYDTYLQDYANYRKMPVSGMIEIADEIEDSTKEFADFVSWYENLYNLAKSVKEQAKQKDRNAGVTLTTMHSAKGLEFKYVWIIDLVEGVIPHSKSNTSVQVEEERRLFYVALTRAQKELKLLVPKVRYGKAVQQSAFLVDVMLKEQNFQLNQKIRHKTYGLGVIKRIEGTKGTVTFKNGERKIMDLAVCLKKHLIKLEEN